MKNKTIFSLCLVILFSAIFVLNFVVVKKDISQFPNTANTGAIFNCTTDCFSSVLFLPGLKASRLYKKRAIIGSEDQLWEPNDSSDVIGLYLNDDGTSKNLNIYTRDIVSTTNYPVSNEEIYQSFINQMNNMVAAKTINGWKPFPYDWRLRLETIVNNPTILANNMTANLIKMVEDEAQDSKTGKITIIAHSNGGLVAKLLINALVAKGEENLVDNIIMVATPQFGTPKSIPSLLHGDGEEITKGLLLDANTARKFGENMPAAYNLLPSSKYFSTISIPVINFDESIGDFGNWRKLYGESIDTMSEFADFLYGGDGRKKAEQYDYDLQVPNVLNSNLLADSIVTHRTIDAWTPPSNIKLYQVAGWGIATISTLTYTKPPLLGSNPSRALLGKNDGDQTVVMDSATATSSPNSFSYYVDLDKINATGKKIEHDNIFQAQPIEDLIKNILTGVSTLPTYISSTKPTDIRGFTVIEMHSPVDIHLYDAEGNHTGPAKNPIPGSDFTYIEENIPGTTYTAYGEDKYITIDPTKIYTLKLQGKDQGIFTLQISDHRGITPIITSFAGVPTSSIMKGEMSINLSSKVKLILALDTDGNGSINTIITPNMPLDSILYFDLLRNTIRSLNLKPNFETDLLIKIDEVEKQPEKGYIELPNFISRFDFSKSRLKSQTEKDAFANSINSLLDGLK